MRHEADERQANNICNEKGIAAGSEWVDTPCVQVAGAEDDGKISASEMTRFRALMATMNLPCGGSARYPDWGQGDLPRDGPRPRKT